MTSKEQRAMLDRGGRRAHLIVTKDYYMEGLVENEHFHVTDTVSDGVSERSLGGNPRYNPISLEKIAAKGHEVKYFD